MKRKLIIWRLIIEVLILLIVFNATDMMTAPSQSTAIAVQGAVNKQLLDPICMIEVINAIRSASFIRGHYL
jgi:hypothetical protein